MQLGLGHHLIGLAQMFPLEGQHRGDLVVVTGSIGDDQPSAAPKVAIDLLGFDQRHNIVEGSLQLAKHGDGMVGALCRCQLRKTMLEGATDKPGVAGAGAEPRLALFQNHDAAPGVRQCERGGESGVT